MCIGAILKGIRKNVLPPSSGWWSKAYVTRRYVRIRGEERRYEIITRGRIVFRELEGAITAKHCFISIVV